jgi:hypothetical protein
MNMAVDLEEDRQHFDPPRSVRDALRSYSRWRHFERPNAWPPESPLYAVWKEPGRGTSGSQDGGMAARMDRIGKAFAMYAWTLEIRSAVLLLPPDMLKVIQVAYEVPPREEPKSEREVAEAMKISRTEAARRLERAYGYLARHLCLEAI